ncbi:MAG: ATP synthase F1 subunit epsilon [Spirochaetaceae bacterium]|nr:ATP synthase F1 subunit epsilon [Spirochaetaceae bacterium]
MRLEVITIERHAFDEQVEMVIAPGASGVLGILPSHAPLMSALKPGALEVRIAGQEPRFIAVGGGFIEVQPDHVVVLAGSAEHGHEIDLERAREARRAAREHMERERAGDRVAFEAAMHALLHQEARLHAAETHHRRSASGAPPRS